MLKGLSEGVVVHYVLAAHDLAVKYQHLVGEHRAAVVVNPWCTLNRDDGYSNLLVFCDGSNDGVSDYLLWATSRVMSEGKEPGTWHWPEREEA
jgi:hypothetical protein